MGDVHGNWGALNSLMNKLSQKNPDENIKIFQLGDFGYWWTPTLSTGFDENGEYFTFSCTPEPNTIKIPENVQLYWVDGNHENHNEREKYALGEIHEIEPRFYYCARFSTLELPEIGKLLFIGGADSIDKHLRTEDKSWWKNEIISAQEMDFFYENLEKFDNIDIVVSHTCPNYFELKRIPTIGVKGNDPSKKALDIILDECNPKLWYFGHYHRFQTGKHKNTNWRMLNMSSQTNWYEEYVK